MTVIIGALLAIPLMMVYALVWDRQSQSQTAQASIAQGWGGAQVLAGPVLVIPYETENVETVTENGKDRTRTVKVEANLYLSPLTHKTQTELTPERRRKAIYESVLFRAGQTGRASFALPADLNRYGVTREVLKLDRAELRFGVSDARGLQSGAKASVNGVGLELLPGKGLNATNGSGFFGFVTWDGTGALDVAYDFAVHGSGSLSLVPRGGNTDWQVKSPWAHPSFGGNFLPATRKISDAGFTAAFGIPNLALGQAIVMTDDPSAPIIADPANKSSIGIYPVETGGGAMQSQAASIHLVEPVDLYSQVDRAVKYGFLFIGFTFLAFLMFDIIGGARVAAAEYLLTGTALVLFFVLLLAFAEVIGFTFAYLLASAAVIGLLSAYSAAVLGSWARARFIGALLLGLYALLYVLLNLEAYSLLIGSVLLFIALAAVMFATRRVDWSGLTRGGDSGDIVAASPVSAPASA